MRSKHSILAGAAVLALLACQLKADVQARVNVVAHALASAKGLQVQTLAVSGFTDSATGRRPPFAAELEADLRQALAHYASAWDVLGADGKISDADALLTGSFQRSGADIQVHVELRAQPDGTVLWQRNTVLDASDVADADLPAAPATAAEEPSTGGGMDIPQSGYAADDSGGGDQVIPSLPWRRQRDYYDGYTLDFSLAYQAFFPTNGNFQGVAGKLQNGVSFGLDINDVFLWDMAFWNQDVSNLGTAQSLSYAGTDLALVYPFHLGDHFTLYVGPGGRFGEISVQDPALYRDGVGFGNNALDVVAGAKFTADNVGLDLRYSGDLVSSYTGYNTLRLGAFYEFGR